jgi:hypothetical protein
MNKNIIASLNKIANSLDDINYSKEADLITNIMEKLAMRRKFDNAEIHSRNGHFEIYVFDADETPMRNKSFETFREAYIYAKKIAINVSPSAPIDEDLRQFNKEKLREIRERLQKLQEQEK